MALALQSWKFALLIFTKKRSDAIEQNLEELARATELQTLRAELDEHVQKLIDSDAIRQELEQQVQYLLQAQTDKSQVNSLIAN